MTNGPSRTLFYVPKGWIGYVTNVEGGPDCKMISTSALPDGWIADLTLRRRENLNMAAAANSDAGYISYNMKDWSGARTYLHAPLMFGRPKAEYEIATIYERGLSVPADPQYAGKLYLLAANQNYKPAQIRLAILYDQGIGVPKDTKQAEKWRARAAKNPSVELDPAAAIDRPG
jgi:hypothetical protein